MVQQTLNKIYTLQQEMAEKEKWADMYKSISVRATNEAEDAVALHKAANSNYGKDHPITLHLLLRSQEALNTAIGANQALSQANQRFEEILTDLSTHIAIAEAQLAFVE